MLINRYVPQQKIARRTNAEFFCNQTLNDKTKTRELKSVQNTSQDHNQQQTAS